MSTASEDWLEHYVEILGPLFSRKGVDTFEFACVLLRVEGMQDKGWDSLQESNDVLQDLIALTQLELPPDRFKDREKTGWRLVILAYAHFVEMDAPYHVLANFLRVRAGDSYVVNPFRSLGPKKPKTKKKLRGIPPLSPGPKIRLIKQLSEKVSLPTIGTAFDDFYYPSIRNAISHSDYVLHENEFRMLQQRFLDEETNVWTQVVPLDRLRIIVSRSFAFYSRFFTLVQAARKGFTGLRGKCFPYDPYLKGLIEFLISDEDLLCGFKIHWPNDHDSVYRRTEKECKAANIDLNSDGSINFFVGHYPKDHEPFSRLVPKGEQPRYTACEGQKQPPSWPGDSDK